MRSLLEVAADFLLGTKRNPVCYRCGWISRGHNSIARHERGCDA